MSGPNYLDRKPPTGGGPDYLERKDGVDWRKHEADVAKRSGGRVRAASGAAPGKPADTIDQNFLRECKATKGMGMSINGKWLAKICREALPRCQTPLLELRFDGQEAPTPSDWVMIPAQDFEILLEQIRGEA
jgi:hypothetical protein